METKQYINKKKIGGEREGGKVDIAARNSCALAWLEKKNCLQSTSHQINVISLTKT